LSSLHDKKNGQICASFTLLKNKNAFGLKEALDPLPTDQGLCPWNPLGFPPPDRRNRLVLCTCHEPPTFTTKFMPMLVGRVKAGCNHLSGAASLKSCMYIRQLNYMMHDNSVTRHQSHLLSKPSSMRLILYTIDPTCGNSIPEVLSTVTSSVRVEWTVFWSKQCTGCAGSSRTMSVTLVKVNVHNAGENDNPLTFDRPEVEVGAMEVAAARSWVAMLPQARDIDGPSHSMWQYLLSLRHIRMCFLWSTLTLESPTLDVSLVTLTTLDHKHLDQYQ